MFGWIWGVLRPDLVALVGLPLAIVVTGHVLLRKRSVAASVGWIGLAWLSPILGAWLYFLFGISRVTRRARQVRGTVAVEGGGIGSPVPGVPAALAPLDRAVQAITGNPLEAGHRVAVLRNGQEAYPAMLDAIGEARRTIALSSYILRADRIGSRFLAALVAARDRGVAVRVLVDGIGSGYFLPGAYGRLRAHGIPAGRFMHSPLPWRMPFLNLRSHKKLLVVDGRTAFIGGLNIGDEDLPADRERPAVLDTHLRIEGPVARQLAADFARDWAFVTNEELGADWFPEPPADGPAAARAVSSGPDSDIETIEFVILQAIGCAQRSIRIMTPYFLPSDLVVTSLAMAAMRGVSVDIVIPARSNHRFVDWATRAHVGPLLERGVRIWQNPPPFDHSKLMVVDETWCLVGSANLDMRSLRLNFELNVELYDTDLAAALGRFMGERSRDPLRGSDIANRSLPRKLRDAAVRLALPYL